MYNCQTFATEDEKGMLKHVLQGMRLMVAN